MDEPLKGSPPPKPRQDFVVKILKNVTVEPTLILYMLAFMITTVIEQSFFVYKACIVDHGYNETICRNLNNKTYVNITKEVQMTVSTFHQWNDIAGHAGQIILAFFMGSWSDKHGRKLPLLMGLVGKLYYSTMIVVNSLQPTWPVEYIIYTATLPMTLTGADVAIFAAAFTYLVDITTKDSRTMRVTILEVCYLATMPIGIALGAVIFRSVNQSFTSMFTINASLLVCAIVYSIVRLQWRTSANQKPLSGNLVGDFFDYNHVVDTVKTLGKKRTNRSCLLVLIVMMALYTFQRDERNMTFLYCQLVFNWSTGQYSTFRTVQSALQDVGLLIAIPVMSKWLGWRDTFIIMIGAMAHTVARIFYASAVDMWVFYLGGAFAAFGPIVAPVIRSMVSKIVVASEKGKAFSVLGVADNAIPLVSGVLYSQLYNFTLHTHPEAIFYLTMASQVGVLVLVVYIHSVYKEDNSNPDLQIEVES